MKLLRETVRKILLENMTNKAWSFFNQQEGFEQMTRREMPSKELLSINRNVYYGRYISGNCQTLFQIEETEIYDFVNNDGAQVVYIHGLRSTPPMECQGKGMGTHVMNKIMEFADSLGIGVAGDVVPYGSSKMSRDGMKAFDARFGLLPLEHYLQFLDPLDAADEDVMFEINEYIDSNADMVWRPAKGSLPEPL